MSELLRIALIAEGPTDAIIIEAALKALLPNRPFLLNLLQPEPTQPRLGNGWGGVLRWCHSFASSGQRRLESDPTLPGYDLFILHIDADIADKSYSDVSAECERHAQDERWPPLPGSTPCPPASESADYMRRCLLSWSGLSRLGLGPRTVLYVPSKAIDAWLAAAILANGHRLLANLECNLRLEAQLESLPKAERVKKKQREYRSLQEKITKNWDYVRRSCSQAERFSHELTSALP